MQLMGIFLFFFPHLERGCGGGKIPDPKNGRGDLLLRAGQLEAALDGILLPRKGKQRKRLSKEKKL